jgi:hypothetical protein
VVTTTSYRFPVWSSHYGGVGSLLVCKCVSVDDILLDEVLLPTQVQ